MENRTNCKLFLKCSALFFPVRLVQYALRQDGGLTLKLPGEGQMALPLEILAYGSHKKRKCVIEYECKFSI